MKQDAEEAGEDRRVLRRDDQLRGRLGSFRRKVERALALIEEVAALGPVGVSFSGGKDSTVLLDLVRRVIPDAPAGFFDDNAQLADTYAFVAATPNLEVVKVEPDLIEMCRIGGYWGYVSRTPDVNFNFERKLVDEPAAEFARRRGLAVQAIGIRTEESVRRYFYARRFGKLYRRQGFNAHNLCPLLGWTVDDIWAYVATYDLPYNRAYDKMASFGMRREEMRVAQVLGDDGAGWGRFAYLKQLDPALWNRLAAEFPAIRKYV